MAVDLMNSHRFESGHGSQVSLAWTLQLCHHKGNNLCEPVSHLQNGPRSAGLTWCGLVEGAREDP